jgi:hypothetical protein
MNIKIIKGKDTYQGWKTSRCFVRFGVLTAVAMGRTILCVKNIFESVLYPDVVTGFLNLPNPCSRTMAQGSTQPLTEMSTRNLPRGKGWQAHKTDNLTAICEPTV